MVLPLPPEGQPGATVWLGKGPRVLRNRDPLRYTRPVLISPPKPRGACCLWERTDLTTVLCRPGHANPSDMLMSRLAEHRTCSLDPANQDCLSASLSLKLIVLVLPIQSEACSEYHNHPGNSLFGSQSFGPGALHLKHFCVSTPLSFSGGVF